MTAFLLIYRLIRVLSMLARMNMPIDSRSTVAPVSMPVCAEATGTRLSLLKNMLCKWQETLPQRDLCSAATAYACRLIQKPQQGLRIWQRLPLRIA